MFNFTKKEIRDLIISFIVVSIAFAIATVKLDLYGFISVLPIIMVGVGIGVLFHELGHKYMAMQYGFRSEYEMWPLGLAIALVSSFTGFVFAIPGSAHTYADNLTDEIYGRISLAGPMTNVALALIFIIIASVAYPFSSNSNIALLIYLIGAIGFSVNSFLAAFNLFPLYTLDGTKVLKWSKGVWLVSFVVAGIMVLLSIMICAENMVKMIVSATLV